MEGHGEAPAKTMLRGGLVFMSKVRANFKVASELNVMTLIPLIIRSKTEFIMNKFGNSIDR